MTAYPGEPNEYLIKSPAAMASSVAVRHPGRGRAGGCLSGVPGHAILVPCSAVTRAGSRWPNTLAARGWPSGWPFRRSGAGGRGDQAGPARDPRPDRPPRPAV